MLEDTDMGTDLKIKRRWDHVLRGKIIVSAQRQNTNR